MWRVLASLAMIRLFANDHSTDESQQIQVMSLCMFVNPGNSIISGIYLEDGHILFEQHVIP